MDFTGKTAVVTGAASGMGKATAIGFAKAGANVALLDVDERGGAEEVAELIGDGATTMVCAVDLTQPAQVREVLRSVQEHFGRVDVLANVAGIYPRASVPDVTEEFWDRVHSVNLRGAFFCCQEALRIMEAQGGGAIANVASGAAFRAIDGLVAYSASKAGLVGMTRVLALEYARKGVRVNVVAPGHTASDASIERMGQATIDAMAETLVPGRWMTPEEQANAIIWVCSDEASGLSGAIINVNGGNFMP